MYVETVIIISTPLHHPSDPPAVGSASHVYRSLVRSYRGFHQVATRPLMHLGVTAVPRNGTAADVAPDGSRRHYYQRMEHRNGDMMNNTAQHSTAGGGGGTNPVGNGHSDDSKMERGKAGDSRQSYPLVFLTSAFLDTRPFIHGGSALLRLMLIARGTLPEVPASKLPPILEPEGELYCAWITGGDR